MTGVKTCAVPIWIDTAGRIVISSYPERAKSKNLRRDSRASLCVLSDDFGDEWVHVDGTAEVIEVSDAVEPLVEYFRVISGEHSDWDEYRRAMINQGKVLIRITIDAWRPISRGWFPPRLALARSRLRSLRGRGNGNDRAPHNGCILKNARDGNNVTVQTVVGCPLFGALVTNEEVHVWAPVLTNVGV